VQDYYYNNSTLYNTARKDSMKKVKVHDPRGDVMADVYDYAAAALLMSLYGNGSSIRYKNRILWLEGADGEGAESYDTTAITIIKRLDEAGIK
jgi:hypothetical protein